MKLGLVAISCTALLSAAAIAESDRLTSDDHVSYKHPGSVTDLRIVHIFLMSETVSDFSAIEGSGLSDEEILHLKGLASSLTQANQQRDRLYFQRVCNEGSRLMNSPDEFRAFYLLNSRETQQAELRGAMNAVESLSAAEYEWLQRELASITFTTGTTKDPNYVPDPEKAVQRSCRAADAMG